jgi:hypothetical protein
VFKRNYYILLDKSVSKDWALLKQPGTAQASRHRSNEQALLKA